VPVRYGPTSTTFEINTLMHQKAHKDDGERSTVRPVGYADGDTQGI